ncbi:Kelch domain-containing protein 10 [Thelohanellus kitauei]|uniref:Kelch domain-containing protein 10 n=1 Tax=Thelohanellus kitauei TaxID=669202 RepID=A0A0C2IL24_THEKT|nr:Kelch domain-containing protein 10 [Thelohanellus kitauei]
MKERTELAGPENRIYHCMTSVRQFLIIFGGWSHSTNKNFNELWIYNTINSVWKRYNAPIETENTCAYSCICAVGYIVYIFGMTVHRFIGGATNCFVSFDISKRTWQNLSPRTIDDCQYKPRPMYGHFIFYLNGSLYILGQAENRGYVDTLLTFCLKTSKWSLVPQNGKPPIIEHGIFGTVFKNQIYVFGGYPITGTNRFRDVTIFDFSTNTWSTRGTSPKTKLYPHDRVNESFAFSSNFGYLCGGESSKGYHYDIWRIDLETLEWLKLDYSLKNGLKFNSMSVVDDSYLYSFGGRRNADDILNTFEMFTVQPPSLYHLCLESISRSPRFRNRANSLPIAFQDDLNLDNNDSSFYVNTFF